MICQSNEENGMGYIDLHCDALLHFFSSDDFDLFSSNQSSVDFLRLHQAGASAQCFAIYQPTADELMAKNMKDDEYIPYIYQRFSESLERNDHIIAPAVTSEDIIRNQREGLVSAILTLEDGRSINGDLHKLEEYRKMGIRMITLTWFQKNCFGSPSSDNAEVMNTGLTPFGREAVEKMNDLGIIIDASHLSDGGFWDLIRLSRKPFVASHSNCRALVPHFRNLSDEMIKALADKGGVMGLNFCHFFLRDVRADGNIGSDVINEILFKSKKMDWVSSVADMTRHVLHAYHVGGEDVLAIGTDFDGIARDKLEIDSPLQMDKLFTALKKAGLPGSAIEKFIYRNALRVLHETEKL